MVAVTPRLPRQRVLRRATHAPSSCYGLWRWPMPQPMDPLSRIGADPP